MKFLKKSFKNFWVLNSILKKWLNFQRSIGSKYKYAYKLNTFKWSFSNMFKLT